jgi:hypothetical protein
MPPKVIIPAGASNWLAHAVDFLKQAGQDVAPQDIGNGIATFISITMQKFGLDPNKVMTAAGGGGAQQPEQQQPAPGPQDQAAGPSDMGGGDEPPPQGA